MPADLLNAATAVVDWLATLDPAAILLFTFLAGAVEMTFVLGLLIPGESVVMLAGSLPAGPAGFALVVTVGTAGALSGQISGYALGRVFGPRLLSTRLGRRIGPQRFARAETYLRERGGPALAAVRFVAVIHSIVPIVAGSVRMPFGRFLAWSALGTVLWVGTFAGVGLATAGATSSDGVAVVLTAVGATCLGAVPLGLRLLRRIGPSRPAPALVAESAPARVGLGEEFAPAVLTPAPAPVAEPAAARPALAPARPALVPELAAA